MFDPFFIPPRWRRKLVAALVVVCSATTLTVVHSCVMKETVKIQVPIPVREAAQAMHGTVVAAARVNLPRRDTLVVHDTVVTTRVVLPRGVATGSTAVCKEAPAVTRTARFRDSTFAGVVDAIVTAPPDSAALGVTYHIERPEFTPTVAFVATAGGGRAIVSWQGERVTLDHVTLTLPQAPRVTRSVQVEYHPVSRVVTVGASVGVRLPARLEVVASLLQPVTFGAVPIPIVSLRRSLN